jgi:hypothetical protein
MVGRRQFLVAGAVGGAALLPSGATAHGPGSGDGSVPWTPRLRKYVDPLPRPVTAIPDPSAYPGADYYEISMRQGSWGMTSLNVYAGLAGLYLVRDPADERLGLREASSRSR